MQAALKEIEGKFPAEAPEVLLGFLRCREFDVKEAASQVSGPDFETSFSSKLRANIQSKHYFLRKQLPNRDSRFCE
jgi:hypothetical protein